MNNPMHTIPQWHSKYIFVTLLYILSLFLGVSAACAEKMLIPMDFKQKDHLKAYGVAYHALSRNISVEWLLNYRGGSFLLDADKEITEYTLTRGVSYETPDAAALARLDETIRNSNMSRELLEKAPKVAVYTPPNKRPWDDAVTLALTYAEIPYETLWDEEVMRGDLKKYDWLHLHHEDFTGQYGKFYGNYRGADWYIQQQIEFEAMAKKLGFRKVSDEKKAIAEEIRSYTDGGGFVFAMCSATDSFDIALAAHGTDIAGPEFDGDAMDPDCQSKLDFSHTLAFENFKLVTDPYIYEFSDIDITPPTTMASSAAEAMDYFELFEFSAKYDPVPAMLTQDHENPIGGFMGQTTEFKKSLIKKNVVIMGENKSRGTARYIHGNLGKGTWTFLGGHDPEDYRHQVGDPTTQLFLHKNSPGYRLILNNVLFPGAKKKELKT
ncbi:MAG: asparagine synthetase B [Candidatus Latescibacter sp.]|nr:asparagine synthetase B [Candidatus Latescibacter sp.]